MSDWSVGITECRCRFKTKISGGSYAHKDDTAFYLKCIDAGRLRQKRSLYEGAAPGGFGEKAISL